jgi:hypothetical protein
MSVYPVFFYTAFLLSTVSTNACVEYHPPAPQIQVIVNYDTECNMEVRITNLRLGAGGPGQFCSCGIGSAFPTGVELVYIAFVDSITGIPVPGFDGFQMLGSAGASWSEFDPQEYDWQGFVSSVNASGLLQDHPVDLVIRAKLYTPDCVDQILGYTIVGGDTVFFKAPIFSQFSFGTDEWNQEESELMLSHNSITYLSAIPIWKWSYHPVSAEYFDQLDAMLDPNSVIEINEAKVTVFPNPFQTLITIGAGQPGISKIIIVRDAMGRKVAEWLSLESLIQRDLSELDNGLFFIEVNSGKSKSIHRILKSGN